VIDQAAALRSLVRDRASLLGRDSCLLGQDSSLLGRDLKSRPNRERVYTIAVTSGKGGVGKTSIAVNLAILLARAGRGVRLVDADFGLSNAEVLLGVTPAHTLEDVIRGRVDIADAWLPCAEGVRLLSSGSGLEAMANIDGADATEVMSAVIGSASDGDIIVIDTAPGIDGSVLSLLALADEVLMVTTPEPTSITDTYAAIKVLMSAVPEPNITLVANCCSVPAQAGAVADGLDGICKRFLSRSFERYEYVPYDPSVGRAIQRQKPLAVTSSHAPAASWLRRVAIKVAERARKHEAKVCKVFRDLSAAEIPKPQALHDLSAAEIPKHDAVAAVEA
jgi:flagellar biosynthesis protein FlhG